MTGSQTITASTPAASALRRIVPKFPGFSIASTTRETAPAKRKSESERFHCGAIGEQSVGALSIGHFGKRVLG